MIFGTLRYLHVPQGIRKPSVYLTVIGTTHWQHNNSNTQIAAPSTVQAVRTRILSLLNTLLTSTHTQTLNRHKRIGLN